MNVTSLHSTVCILVYIWAKHTEPFSNTVRHMWQTLYLGGSPAEVRCRWGAARSLGTAAGALCSAGSETAGWGSGGWAWDRSTTPRPANQCGSDSAGPAHRAWNNTQSRLTAAVRDWCFNALVHGHYWSIISKTKKQTNLDVVPEGQGKVCHKSIALSDQEGAVPSAALHAEVLNQALGHLPAFLHAAMKPGLCKLLFRVLEGRQKHTMSWIPFKVRRLCSKKNDNVITKKHLCVEK